MKVAVSSRSENLDSEVDPRFGRAPFFLVVDTDTGDQRMVDNKQNLEASQGAGVQAAQTVIQQGVDALVTGHCGPKAYRTLNSAGIKIYVGVTGTVRDAVAKLVAGELAPATGSDVEGHWV